MEQNRHEVGKGCHMSNESITNDDVMRVIKALRRGEENAKTRRALKFELGLEDRTLRDLIALARAYGGCAAVEDYEVYGWAREYFGINELMIESSAINTPKDSTSKAVSIFDYM